MDKRISIHPRKKQKILERDNFKCVNCGGIGDFNALEVDHIIPVINGGTNKESNLQTLCYKCNMDKKNNKNNKNLKLLDYSPLEKLKMIKERIYLYKDLTHAEFKVIYTQDDLLNMLNIDLLYLNDLFFQISGCKRKRNDISSKNKDARDRLIYYLYENKHKLDLTQEKIAEIANIDKKTVWNVVNSP